ncbi:uncharacterized protein LOC6566168 [Drosophila grimshawi]|uniref:GH24763 n=1 Tax=Drosophila grimshawi TaxID=7222 RepID=B4JN69_DROGR|nr:uncharacterized protein LOC6566168 [Drosophila grimshawi]XP_032594707.1 uncharacterized protein LOC6566168 [Drosophila grimshawi]EDV92162.1 GH24763 [Drosophila grimshawi]
MATHGQQVHLSAGILLMLMLMVMLMPMLTSSLAVTKSPTAAKQEAEHKNAEFPEEDSDMLMEPNDFTPITVLRSHEQQHYHMPPTTQLQQNQRAVVPIATPIQSRHFQAVLPLQQEQFRPIANPNTQLISRADVTAGPGADLHSQAAQNFYPPFYHEAPPLGHSRPYFSGPAVPVGDNSPLQLPLLTTSHQQQPQPQQHQQRGFDAAILGSGDFGVLRGGTFYPEEEMPYHPEDNSDYIYGDANNGHGRPSEAFVQKYTYPEEQFANFRDFADINTPADSAFSQFVVVYAAKNATKPSSHPHPKNIFEQLELLDREKALEEAALKKQQPSKSKSKLSKTKLQKKYKKKTIGKEVELEPLLALS